MVTSQDLRDAVRRLMKQGKLKTLYAYRKGAGGGHAVPAFIRDAEGVEDLTWDPTCVHNLSRYLIDEKRKREKAKTPPTHPMALVVKGCDSRAINVLIQEKFVKREDLYLIGISCEHSGMADPGKVARKFAGQEISDIKFTGEDTFIVVADGKEKVVPASDLLADRCLECPANFPVVFDLLLGDKTKRNTAARYKDVEKIESLNPDQKWAFWTKALEACIRCYACRSICPMCYCDECVVDSISQGIGPDTPAEEKAQRVRWIERSPDLSETLVYHMIRTIHLAGRCIDCGECQRACPVDIPLRLLNKKMEKDAREIFQYETGFTSDQPSLVSSFRDEDPEDFIR